MTKMQTLKIIIQLQIGLKIDLSIKICLVEFYGIATIVGYLMQNSLCTYIFNIYDLIWSCFKAYQPL